MANLYDKASLVLPVSPAYKDGVIQAYKPLTSEGTFNFSRGSNLAATRVNSDGLIEKGRENLLTYSNDFSNAAWTKFFASVTSGQTGYDGSSNAWLLNITTSQNSSLYRSISMSGVYTTSVYAKANSVDYLGIRDYTLSGAGNWFNLSNGTITSTTSNCIDAKIESVGNGWYKCSITQNRNATGYTQIGASDNPSTISTTSGSIYIQDAQLEQGLVATDYIETTTTTAVSGITEDLPRLDYSGGASCPALLLEPQRTNSFTQSEYIEGSSWSQDVADFTRVSNQGVSPDGKNNSTKITPIIAGSPYWYQNNSVTSGTIYSNSIFAKADGFNVLQITGSTGMPFGKHNFDLSSGTHSGDYSSVFMEDYGNGWYRCGISEAASSTTSGARFLFAIVPDIASARLESVTPSGSNGILVYGAQFEEGSYPTSYIPTYGSSVTRSGDSCSKTGISSLIGQTEGTLFAEFEIGVDFAHFFLYTNTSNAIYIQTRIGDSWRAYVINGGVYEVIIVSGSVPTSGFVKMAFAYKENDFVLYANGSLIQADTSGSVPVCDSYDLGLGPYGAGLAAKRTKQTILFPTRLSNTELAALTTI